MLQWQQIQAEAKNSCFVACMHSPANVQHYDGLHNVMQMLLVFITHSLSHALFLKCAYCK